MSAYPRIAWDNLDAAAAVHEERHDGADQEDHEQDFGDSRGAHRDSAKSEHGGDQRYDKKHDGVMKHGVPLKIRPASNAGQRVLEISRAKYFREALGATLTTPDSAWESAYAVNKVASPRRVPSRGETHRVERVARMATLGLRAAGIAQRNG